MSEVAKRRVVQLLSGGLDSTVLMYYLKNQGHDLRTISVMYGQRHSKEVLLAAQHASALRIQHNIIELATLGQLLRGSCLTDRSVPVPDGHYAEESMKLTVVPNRNMIMISIAASIAIAEGYDTVAYASHSGDHTIYPDCRPPYVKALKEALNLCDWKTVDLWAPFVLKDKAAIVTIGSQLAVPFEITWSCYKGLAAHCGKCGACNERKEAFTKANVPDPTVYGVPEGMTVLPGST